MQRLKRTYRSIQRVGLNAAAAIGLSASLPAVGEPIGLTGIENLLWPAAVVAAPFKLVHFLLFGSDDSSRTSAYRRTVKLLDQSTVSVEGNGVYTGPIELRHDLNLLLGEGQQPFVEVDLAGSKWLFEQLENPAPLLTQVSVERPYIRLALAEAGSASCVPVRAGSQFDAMLKSALVRPGTCLTLSFDNRRHSEYSIVVDTRKAAQRELHLLLQRTADGETLLALPFWQPQREGQPLRVYSSDTAFWGMVKRMKSRQPLRGADGHLLALGRGPDLLTYPAPDAVATVAQVDVVAGELPKRRALPDWPRLYQQGMDTGQPQIINHELFLPASQSLQRIGSAERVVLAGGQLLLGLNSSNQGIWGWQLHGLDLASNTRWAMQLKLVFVPELAAQCDVPQSRIQQWGLQSLETASFDSEAITLEGLVDADSSPRCRIRLRVAWPGVTDNTTARTAQ